MHLIKKIIAGKLYFFLITGRRGHYDMKVMCESHLVIEEARSILKPIALYHNISNPVALIRRMA